MPESKSIKISIRVKPTIYNKLVKLSRKEEMWISDVVREAIYEYLVNAGELDE